MKVILDDYQRKVVQKQCIAILQSPQGRDLGRWFLLERGKGEEGDLGAVKREIFDVLSDTINDLYAAPPPTTTYAQPS